jgi:hypothetical protein
MLGYPDQQPEDTMILVVFIGLAVVGQLLNVFLCLAIDRMISPAVGVLAFVFLYIVVFWISWRLALLIVDKEARQAVGERERRMLALAGGVTFSMALAD